MDVNKNKSLEDVFYWFLIILILVLYVCYPLIYTPITNVHCNKSENYCTIKQNFFSNSVHRLYDDDFLLINLQFYNKSYFRGVKIDYELITLETKDYYSHYDKYTYDTNPLAASKFRKDFSSYLDNKSQNLFDKLHIPIYYIGLLSCLLLFLVGRKNVFKNILIIYVLVAPFALNVIFYIWNIFF